MTPVTGILFDKDGTLFDFQSTWAGWARLVLDELSGGDPAAIAAMAEAIGFDRAAGMFRPDSVVVAETVEAVAAALYPHSRKALTEPELVDHLDLLAAEAPLAEAVPLGPFLDGLARRGLKLGVVTNDSEVPARAHLETTGILGRFDFVAGYDSGHGAKPAAGPLLAAAAAWGMAPAAMLMVGDSRHDLMAGRAAGMRTVGVLTGVAAAEDLAPLADAILADIGALPGWLDGLAR